MRKKVERLGDFEPNCGSRISQKRVISTKLKGCSSNTGASTVPCWF